jgi:hypothetical protein
MAQEVLVAPREVRVVPVAEVSSFRAELSRVMREFWASPSGRRLALELSHAAINTGFADDMKRIMSGVRESIRAAAQRANLSGNYKRVWGK